MSSYAESDAIDRSERLFSASRFTQGIICAVGTVGLASAVVLWKPLYRAMWDAHVIGYGAAPGPAIVVCLALITMFAMLGKNRGAAVVATGCMSAVIGLDFLPYSLVHSEETLCLAAALLIVIATFRTGSAMHLSPFLKVAYCLLGAAELAVFIFNANDPYGTMHFFGGGSVV